LTDGLGAVAGWPELVSVALLGTERRDPPALADPALAGLVGGSTEERLLSAAGSLAVFRRAGRLAPAAPPLPQPAPAEVLPACGGAAAYRLLLLLDDHRALLPEWLRAVAARGLRVPAERLPDLLEAATASQALRADVEPVLGERGRWLAARSPRWGWAAPLPAAEEERQSLWLTGTRPERHRLFAELRRTRPAEARELLEPGFAREEAADRVWFTGALGEGLSPADEPLLESALDDRRQEVRYAAARLLARLPGSALARRMTERTIPLLSVENGAVRATLPDHLDEPAIRDGIIRRPSSGTGERAWWLHQLVAATPLAAWEGAGLTPELAATLPVTGDLEVPLRRGFAQAAEAQRNPRWATAFLNVNPRLAGFADPRRAAIAALEHLRAGETGIADALQAPWPRELGEGALEVLAKIADRGHWINVLIAERLDPGLAGEALRRVESVEPGTSPPSHIRQLIQTLCFRRDMYEELN
jgi:Family of unknown function (DUF5691)